MKPAAILALLASIAVAQSKEVRRSIPLSSTGHVMVDTFKGDVRITTWDQPTVEVYAKIEADGTSPEELRLVNDTEVRIDGTSDSVRIESVYPKNHSTRFNNVNLPFVRYTLRVPRTADLRIKDYKSEIEVSDLDAPLDIDTYKGDSTVHRLNSAIRLHTYKGNARIELSKVSGHNSFETYKGVFDIAVPPGSRFDVISDGGRHANIRSSFPLTIPAGTYGLRSGGRFEARVNGGGGGDSQMVLKSYRGELNLH